MHLFSLSSLCTTNLVTSPLLIFFFLRCSQTHPHTNTSTQINQHKDTQTHPHTNKPTRTNQQRDKSMLGQNDQCLWNDRCLTGTIEACGSCLIGARKSDRAWSVLDRVWSKSWSVFESLIGAWPVWSVFESFARNKAWLDRCLTDFDWCLTELGRVDLCLEMGREMGIEREQQIRKMDRERERESACM